MHEGSSLFFLAVIGMRPVFSLIMLCLDMRGERRHIRIQLKRSQCHLSDALQDQTVVDGILGLLPQTNGA